MAGYLLHEAQEFDCTGIIDEHYEWLENSIDGSRSRATTQTVDENGNEIWLVGISWIDTIYDKEVEKSAVVQVAHKGRPNFLKRHRPIRFKGLRLHVSARLNGSRPIPVERFTADSIIAPTATNPAITKEQN